MREKLRLMRACSQLAAVLTSGQMDLAKEMIMVDSKCAGDARMCAGVALPRIKAAQQKNQN